MATGNRLQTIAVCSHRGGSMKSTVAAILARYFAGEGLQVMVGDSVVAGGVFSLGSASLRDQHKVAIHGIGPCDAKRHDTVNLSVVHLPNVALTRANLQLLKEHALNNGTDMLILDAPTCSRDETAALLSESDLAVVTLPADALSLRSLLPFLREIQEVRAMPGRSFRTVVIPTGTGLRTSEQVALDRFVNDTLSPLLCGADLPWDGGLRDLVGSGKFPEDLPADSPLQSSIRLLGASVRRLLEPESVGA